MKSLRKWLCLLCIHTSGVYGKEIDWLEETRLSGEIAPLEVDHCLESVSTSDCCHEQILQNQKIILERLEALKNKIDNMDKQQRDFLSLMGDIVMNPGHPLEAQEQKDYQKNLDLMKAQQYSAALTQWKKFVKDYPLSDKIPYAYYWLGELLASESNTDLAKQYYQCLIDQYPAHPKTPEAFLKIGNLEMKQGHLDQAKFLFKTLIQKYPHAQATSLAKKSLTDMNTTGILN